MHIHVSMHIHYNAYSFLCIFISMQCIFISMHIHCYAYSLACIFMSMHIHFNAYSFLCIFISMHIHCHAYSFTYVFMYLYIFISMHIHTLTSLCLYTLQPKPYTGIDTKTRDEQKQTDTHSYAAASIRLGPNIIIRDYTLSRWFYNKLYDCRIVCRCYNSYRQAVLYEAILWQSQVVL